MLPRPDAMLADRSVCAAPNLAHHSNMGKGENEKAVATAFY